MYLKDNLILQQLQTVTYSPELNFAKVMGTGYFAGFNWLTIWLKKPLPRLNFPKIVKYWAGLFGSRLTLTQD